MTDDKILDSLGRLRAWVRDFGSQKNTVFIADVETVLNFVDSARGCFCRTCGGLNVTNATVMCVCNQPSGMIVGSISDIAVVYDFNTVPGLSGDIATVNDKIP